MSSPDDSETRQEETAAAAAVCTSGLPAAEEMDDARAIKDVARAISLCLNNKFNEAEELLKPWFDSYITFMTLTGFHSNVRWFANCNFRMSIYALL